MHRELLLTADPIDERSVLAGTALSAAHGAVIRFLGVVRGIEDGAAIAALEYEAFEGMARHQFEKIFDAIESRWPVGSVRVVHRLGIVAAGEASLLVEFMAPHRGEAFAACQFLIDEMKRVVPIWKRPVAVAAPVRVSATPASKPKD